MKKHKSFSSHKLKFALILFTIILTLAGATCERNDLYKNAADGQNSLLEFLLFKLLNNPAPSTLSYSMYSQWTVDNTINAMVAGSQTLYVGGSFNMIMPNCRYGAILDPSTGLYAKGRQVNPVNGSVFAAAPDDAGGWYIGGNFSKVGNQTRNYLARINADGTLNPWMPPTLNGPVNAIAASGTMVFIGGSFTLVDGNPQNYIAAVDGETGMYLPWWNPLIDPAFLDPVMAIMIYNNTVIFGGNFSTFNSGATTRNNIAAADLFWGTLLPWNPGANGGVHALAADSGVIYAGGNFNVIGGQPRQNAGALDPVTANATAWNPSPNFPVNALAVSGGTVYLGGTFLTVGLLPVSRNFIAAVDAAGAVIPSWDANITAGTYVSTITVIDNTVYFGGSFTNVSLAATIRNNAAAVDTATGALLSWDPDANMPVNALSPGDGAMYAGGDFTAISRLPRMNLAAFDIVSGYPTRWNPMVAGTVNAMALQDRKFFGDILYVGGSFTGILPDFRSNIGAINTASGAATPWNPNVSGGPVNAIAVDGSTVYIGGNFTNIGPDTRSNIGAINTVTGAATAWDPNVFGGPVNTIVIGDNTVYVGGSFFQVGTAPPVIRNNIASFYTTVPTDNYTPWDPNANGVIQSLSQFGNIIYAAGSFSNIGTTPPLSRAGLAAVDTTVAVDNAMTWNPSTGSINWATVSPAGDVVYTGGMFLNLGGQPRLRIGAVYTAIDTATPWNPIIGTSWVDRIYVPYGWKRIYAAGQFSDVNGYDYQKFITLDPDGNVAQ